MLNFVVKSPNLLLQSFRVEGSVCQALGGLQASSTWRLGRDRGRGGRKRMRRGLLSLQSMLCSAGVPGYVTVLILRGRPRARGVPAARILSSVLRFLRSRLVISVVTWLKLPKTEEHLMSELEESLPQTFSEALGIPDEVDNLRLKTLTSIIQEEVKYNLFSGGKAGITKYLTPVAIVNSMTDQLIQLFQKFSEKIKTFIAPRPRKSPDGSPKEAATLPTSQVIKYEIDNELREIITPLLENIPDSEELQQELSSEIQKVTDEAVCTVCGIRMTEFSKTSLSGIEKVLKEERRSKKNKKYVQFVIEKVLFTVCSDANMVPETRDELIDSLTETVWSNVQEEQFYIHAEVFKNIQKEIRRSLYKNLSSPENVLFLITHQDPVVVDRILTVVHRKLFTPQRERNIFEKIFSSLGSSISRIFKRTSP
ncbi:unnamed protein product [Tetraodon nigroviridis]|uniref:(spotted green pufferfish) hypothetical protein n=1 Tax=Tetraodon nigroviridis TaxID=99883 RepID=Q4RY95_TETNG|nr:unnamed protein product [Tetraodon nigroviridis]